ncbi:hypothetical protein MMC22_005880 [Lobaria immixta]|nr:hypothetical protein [Lobaria immixta]
MASLPPDIDLSVFPVAAPPPGMTSNFIDPESLATTTMGIGIVMLLLTIFVVIARLFSNYRATRGLGWDDCLCVIGTVLFVIYVGTSLDIRQYARHGYDIPITWITVPAIKKLYLQSITSGPMIFFAKSSLFMLYYRLFMTRRFVRYAIIFGVAFSFVVYFSNMTVAGIMCAPKVGHPWDWTTIAKCYRISVSGFVLGIVNLALDIYLLILPIPVILPLQLSIKKKIGVLGMFMVGLFALVASIVSLVYRIKLWQGTDPTWNGFICVICTMIETGVTIMCSSTSALVSFWKSYIVTYVAPLYSRLCSRYGGLATRLKMVSRASSDTETYREPEHSKPQPTFSYPEPDERHQESIEFSGSSVRTEIGGGSPTSEIENGVIRKLVKVEQLSH